MKSVRRRLLLGTAAATIAIFAAAAIALYVPARRLLISEFDGTLRAKVITLASMTEFDVKLAEVRLDAEDATWMIPEYNRATDPEYFEISSQDGRHLVLSPTLQGRRLDRRELVERGPPSAAFIQLPDGRPGRALMRIARTHPDEASTDELGPEITIVVAKSSAALDRVLARARLLLGTVCGLATVALLGITGWMIRRGLRPLERLARGIAAIGADDLGERLELTDVPQELAPVVSRLNDLLARLEAAFEREKCFTADAAHELRTPLAGLAAALEVCASQRRETPRYEQVVRDCLKVVRQMYAMIDNLLLLARADAGQVPVLRTPVDVAELLFESWARYESVANERGLRVQLELAEDLAVQTDRDKLLIILNNLFDNAVHYSDEAGRVRIEAGAARDVVRISISNTGSRVRPEDATRVFERFWRGDTARGAGGRHSGLGLAVCRRLATALGIPISVQSTPQRLFIVSLELPDRLSMPSEAQLEKNLRMA